MSDYIYQFSRDEIEEINRRTIARLRASRADATERSTDLERWPNSRAVALSRKEMREAFVAVSRKLKGV